MSSVILVLKKKLYYGRIRSDKQVGYWGKRRATGKSILDPTCLHNDMYLSHGWSDKELIAAEDLIEMTNFIVLLCFWVLFGQEYENIRIRTHWPV